MGWFSNGNDRDAYEQVQNLDPQEHRSKFSHELLAGAATFEAERKFEQYEERNGKVENHAMAKEILAGLAGAEADKLFESRGLDFLDREKAKRHAQRNVEERFDEQSFDNYREGNY